MGIPEEDIAKTLDLVTKGAQTTAAPTTSAQTTAAAQTTVAQTTAAAQEAQAAAASDDGFRAYSATNPETLDCSQSVDLLPGLPAQPTKAECSAKLREYHAQNPDQYLFGTYLNVGDNKMCRYGTGDTSDKAKGCGAAWKRTSTWSGCNDRAQCYNMMLDRTGQPQSVPSTYNGN